MKIGVEIQMDQTRDIQWRRYFGTFQPADVLGMQQRVFSEGPPTSPSMCISDIRDAAFRGRDREIRPLLDLMASMIDDWRPAWPTRFAFVVGDPSDLAWAGELWIRRNVDVALVSRLEEALEFLGLPEDALRAPLSPALSFTAGAFEQAGADFIEAHAARIHLRLDEIRSSLAEARPTVPGSIEEWCTLKGMSARESEIVSQLAVHGRPEPVAPSLFISLHTVRNHLKSIYRKTGTHSVGELLAAFLRDCT
jgi:DNA-binding CsgD family transcriptional regulator